MTNSTRPIRDKELRDRDVIRQMNEIDTEVKEQIGDSIKDDDSAKIDINPVISELFEDEDSPIIAETDALILGIRWNSITCTSVPRY